MPRFFRVWSSRRTRQPRHSRCAAGPQVLLLLLLLAPAPAFGARFSASARSAGSAGAAAKAAASAPAAPLAPWEAEPFAAAPGDVLRAAAALDGGGGEPVQVLFSDTRYSYDAMGRETYTHRVVYRIATGAADESWSAVEESWAPWHQQRPEVRARVITADGVVHPLDPAVLTESAEARESPDMFADGRILRAPLPATGPGAVVEQEVSVRDTAPFFDRGVVQVADMAMSVPVHHARLVVEVPAEMPLRYVTRLLPETRPREESLPARRRLTFDYRDLAPLAGSGDPVPGLPPDLPRAPYVAFATGRSWADVAQRYAEIVDETIRGSAPADLPRPAESAGGSRLDRINRLLAWLGEVRYTGIELGKGGLIPRTPAETLQRKFGDCKDKAVLLIAALRALGIPAYAALLNAGEEEPDIEESLPGFGGFNHAIVVVPGDPAIWIDPTDRYARAGELPADDQGRLALIASPTATGLTRTPEATAADNRALKVREFLLSDLGAARAVETDEYWGAPERDLRALYAAEDREALRDSLGEYVKRAYLAKELAAYDFSDPLDLSRPFRLHLEAAETRRAMTDEKSAAVAILPSSLLDQLPEELLTGGKESGRAQPRTADYYFTRPFTLEARYRIVPPAGFVPRPLPAARVRQMGSVTLAEEYMLGEGGVVTATLRLDTGKRRINAKEFELLRAGVREVAEARPTLLLFDQVGEAHLAAGRVREALAEFEHEASAAPDKALPRTRVARALLAGGLGEAAREQAQRGVRLEPRLAAAWRTAGWVLEHDAVGRRFAPGFDRAGALAALRQAKQLDSHDQLTRAELALLLEHDAAGERYGAGAELAAAIAEYRSLREVLKDRSQDDNLLAALMRAERFAEMKELAAGIDETPYRSMLHLVATAATEGADAALRNAERKFGDGSAALAALAAGAQNLIALRRYSAAAALLDRQGQQSADAAALLARAALLRRTRRHEEVMLPDRGPASAARRFVLLLASGRAQPGQLLALLSRSLVEGLGAAQARELAGELAGELIGDRAAARNAAAQNLGLPPDAALDLTLAAYREKVAGDDRLGYRVELSATAEDVAQRQAVFVVLERGEYRVAALGALPALLGLEALHRLAESDLAAARQWLNWAAEEIPAPRDESPGPALAALWKRGAGGELAEARCAAAALVAEGLRHRPAEAILENCKESAAGTQREARLPAIDQAIDQALALAYRLSNRLPELLAAARRLAAARPDAELPFELETAALLGLGRWEEVKLLGEQRLAASPGAAAAWRALAAAAQQEGDLAAAQAALLRLAESGRAGAADFNNLAWLALSRGQADEQAIEQAQRGAFLSGYRDAAPLHTLAALYAELGKDAEAYRLILQAMAARQDQAPASADWYVFGRLAEHYGLPEVARGLYARVSPPGKGVPSAVSTYRLAQARLEELGPPRAARRSGR